MSSQGGGSSYIGQGAFSPVSQKINYSYLLYPKKFTFCKFRSQMHKQIKVLTRTKKLLL